jgi:ribosomal protein S18 acetylase RimI-like enzyme
MGGAAERFVVKSWVMPLEFRFATHIDVPPVVALVESAYRGAGSREGWTTEADVLGGQRTEPELVTEILERPGGNVLLAERDGDLIGCCELQRPIDFGGAAYFGMFAVPPTIQSGGLGSALLLEAERIAREDWGASRLELTVLHVREELIAWYERRGYARTGEIKPFPYGDNRYGLPLRDDLELRVLSKTL